MGFVGIDEEGKEEEGHDACDDVEDVEEGGVKEGDEGEFKDVEEDEDADEAGALDREVVECEEVGEGEEGHCDAEDADVVADSEVCFAEEWEDNPCWEEEIDENKDDRAGEHEEE